VSSSGGSATRFASDALRPELWNEAESFLRKGLERAPSGSDLQLTWYHAYLWAARSDESRQFLAALLSGKRKLPGFRIEQDRRWELVHALARAGYGDAPTLIEETLKKDPSDAGRKEAISAEAAIPEPSVKKKWADLLTRAVAQTELNNAQLREALRSFQAAGQEELTRPFADAYFEALPRLVASGEDEEYLGDFAESFFPALCDVKISEKAREFARRSDLPATVIKSLRESAQEEERCVRARELSASVKAPN
jgi:aminopeptidase N